MMIKRWIGFILAMAVVGWSSAAGAAINYRGRWLLQNEGQKQIFWYVNPADNQRYFVGQPADALNLINALASPVDEKTWTQWSKSGAPKNQSGRLFLVGPKRKAYYLDLKLKIKALGGSQEQMFQTIRSLAGKISLPELAAIHAQYNLPFNGVVIDDRLLFSWPYAGKTYNLRLPLTEQVYKSYFNSQKYFIYSGERPANWHENYYAMFVQAKSGDTIIDELAADLKKLGAADKLSDDQVAELAMNFVQAIPYDSVRSADRRALPNYPYETMYTRLGICTDKSFLAIMILRRLNSGRFF